MYRATIAKERFQTPIDVPGERYEMRDPFAEITYRARTLPEMVAKANECRADGQAEAAGAKVIASIDAKAERAVQVARLEAALIDPAEPMT